MRYDDRPGKLSVAAGCGFWRDSSALVFGAGYTTRTGRSEAAARPIAAAWRASSRNALDVGIELAELLVGIVVGSRSLPRSFVCGGHMADRALADRRPIFDKALELNVRETLARSNGFA
ncbi:hypothetical protein MesoLj113b_73080 (plasmid) [Mesorhizobium sp. 113-3-3]|uniref:YadA-like family protein n=1 Tax=Mesorhizobium sp. 113-3-3 TaxID=2744516 RepID=UPI0018EC49AA|nr:YadA-like family protein [Mesorhizobium sp. 113-3-3]BCG83766.1 hypothetical protein MesoLj113b_73080 [Mesorhizobium sp. 113-3-3]